MTTGECRCILINLFSISVWLQVHYRENVCVVRDGNPSCDLLAVHLDERETTSNSKEANRKKDFLLAEVQSFTASSIPHVVNVIGRKHVHRSRRYGYIGRGQGHSVVFTGIFFFSANPPNLLSSCKSDACNVGDSLKVRRVSFLFAWVCVCVAFGRELKANIERITMRFDYFPDTQHASDLLLRGFLLTRKTTTTDWQDQKKSLFVSWFFCFVWFFASFLRSSERVALSAEEKLPPLKGKSWWPSFWLLIAIVCSLLSWMETERQLWLCTEWCILS